MRNITILAALLASATNLVSQSVDRASLWPDTVKRGEMIRQVRGLGEIAASRTVVLRIAETQVGEIKKGHPVAVDARTRQMLAGVVDSVGTSPTKGTVEVRVSLSRPTELAAGTQVDGSVEIGRLADVVMVGRPAMARPHSETELYKIDPDGAHATRVRVKFGRASVNTIEVLEGLKPGDRVILSDTKAFDRYRRIDLREPDSAAVVPIPRRLSAQQVGEAPRGVQHAPRHDSQPDGVGARFDPPDEHAVERVLGDLPAEAHGRGHDQVAHAVFGRVHLHVPDGGLAEGTELELRAVGGREGQCPKAALPVRRVSTEGGPLVPGVVLDLNEAGDGAHHGVSDVIHDEGIAVVPTPDPADRLEPVLDEGAIQLGAGRVLCGETETVLNAQENAGLQNRRPPLEAGGLGSGRRGVLCHQESGQSECKCEAAPHSITFCHDDF
jgi:hypothetical protein